MKSFLTGFISVCFFLMSASFVFADDAKCALAQKIGQEAIKTFARDKQKGLQQCILAQKQCPGDAVLNYNLGLAYYRYGNLKQAEGFLRKAVEVNSSEGNWLNLLAWVMLDNRSDKAAALEYAKKARTLESNSPAVGDTYIRACLENVRLTEALDEAHKAVEKWPRDKKLGSRYDEAVDSFLAYYLEKSKAGRHDEALEGLNKIGFDARVKNAACWVLHSAGRTEEALAEAGKGVKQFRDSALLQGTFAGIMDRYIQDCYQAFKDGKRAEAVMAADTMKKHYPAHAALKEAYDRMLKAVLEDAKTVDVPAPLKIAARAENSGGRSAGLLAGLQKGGAAENADKGLTVDVDSNIPLSRIKRPDAVAVIIGNRDYARFGHALPNVDYAERDAAYVRKYVINTLGYREDNIIYAADVTQGELARIFGTRDNYKGKLYNWVKAGKSDVFIYYAGHGAPDAAGKSAFLVPVDADVDYIQANGYALDTFYDNLARLPARNITVVLDTCFSGNSAGGMLFKNVSPAMLKTASPVRKIDNAVIVTSAGQDQVSNWYPEMRHSLFTYFFLKGLQGEADKNADGRITFGEMKTYLGDKVPYRARRLTGREQTPVVVGDEQSELACLR